MTLTTDRDGRGCAARQTGFESDGRDTQPKWSEIRPFPGTISPSCDPAAISAPAVVSKLPSRPNSKCQSTRKKRGSEQGQHPIARRWEQTGDVLHKAILRLHRALGEVRPALAQGVADAGDGLTARRAADRPGPALRRPQGLGRHYATVQTMTMRYLEGWRAVSAIAAEGHEDHRDSIFEDRKLATVPAVEAQSCLSSKHIAPIARRSVGRRSWRPDSARSALRAARCARLADIYAPTGHQGGQRLQSTGHYRPTPLDRAGRRGPRDVG